MKYKVSFSRFAYVEADSPEEAEEKAMYEDDAVYEEKKCESYDKSMDTATDEYLEHLKARAMIYKRLAAYEETGLEPEAVEHLKLASMGKAIAEIKEFDGVPIDRLRELAQADREGRCVVLPCRPSDVTVYQLRDKKHARGVGVSPRHIACATVWAGGYYALNHQGLEDCLGCDLGKTWFLNKEEAEAALRREQDG